MPLLDTKTINVATVLAAEARGVIRDVRYWNHATNKFETTMPTSVPFGLAVGAVFYAENTSNFRQRMYFVLTLRRPDGTTKKSITTTAVTVDPGVLMYSEIVDVTDQAGTWTAKADLYGEVI